MAGRFNEVVVRKKTCEGRNQCSDEREEDLSTPSFDYFKPPTSERERVSGKERTAEDVETEKLLLMCISCYELQYNHADGFEIDFETVKARECKIYHSCCRPTPYTHLSGHTSGTLVCQPPSRHPSLYSSVPVGD